VPSVWHIRRVRYVDDHEGVSAGRSRLSDMAEDRDALYQLTYEEAKQALTNQASALDALRSRAGTLLQVTSLATAFLGSLIFDNGLPDGWAPLVGIIAFLGVVLLSLLLLVPLPGWRFTASPKAIVRDFIESDSPANLMETPGSWHCALASGWTGTRSVSTLYTSSLPEQARCWPSRLAPGSSRSRKATDASTPRRRPAESAATTIRAIAQAGPGAIPA
jgi:hypothetical protein